MAYRFADPQSGYPNVNETILAAQINAAIAAGIALQPGIPTPVWDPVYGGGEVIWARANATIPLKQMVSLLPVWSATPRLFIWNAVPVANVTLAGRPVAIALADVAMAAGDYGYFLLTGVTPVSGTADVAADTAFGITAAGQVGANTAGKQISNARSIFPASGTVVKAGSTGVIGDNTINVPDADGLFVGGYLSGTGVGAAAIVSFIDPLGKFIRVTVNNSAAIAGTVTQTNNNAVIFYNTVLVNRSFAQGAIT